MMIDLDKFVGNERSVSATVDLETPSKKVLLKVSKDEGIKWAKENKIDFNFVNKSIIAGMKYAMSMYSEKEQKERKPSIEQTRLFGFIVGVIEYVNDEENEGNS